MDRSYPVVTSVVGMAPSGTAGTTTGTVAARTTTTNTSRNSYGESEQAITIPTTPSVRGRSGGGAGG